MRNHSSVGTRLGTYVCALICLSAPTSKAESIDGRVRFSLEGNVLGYHSLTLHPDAAGVPDTTSSQTEFGLASAGVGPGIGYGASDNVLIDIHASFLTQTVSVEGSGDVTGNGAGLYGALDFVPGSGGSARFFVGPLLGFESTSNESAFQKVSTGNVILGAKLGVLGFAAHSFSIDPSLTAGYAVGGSKVESDIGTPTASSFDFSTTGYFVNVGFALSGWLGGEEKTASSGEAGGGTEAPQSTENGEESAATAPSAPPAAAPQPKPPAGDATELTVTLNNADRVRFTSEPDGSEASYSFILAPKDPNERCTEVVLEDGEEKDTWKVDQSKVIPTGSSSILSITGTISPASLKTAGKRQGKPILVVCGREYELTDFYRQEMRAFAAKMRRLQPANGNAAPDAAP